MHSNNKYSHTAVQQCFTRKREEDCPWPPTTKSKTSVLQANPPAKRSLVSKSSKNRDRHASTRLGSCHARTVNFASLPGDEKSSKRMGFFNLYHSNSPELAIKTHQKQLPDFGRQRLRLNTKHAAHKYAMSPIQDLRVGTYSSITRETK